MVNMGIQVSLQKDFYSKRTQSCKYRGEYYEGGREKEKGERERERESNIEVDMIQVYCIHI
jgi:hypothetical protein